jgi:hypothetical protein
MRCPFEELASDGKRMMSKNAASVLTTVNAPYREKLDEAALVYCLKDPVAAKAKPGHMPSFFLEVSAAAQKEFATSHGISTEALADAAKAFASYSGESYPICAFKINAHLNGRDCVKLHAV